MAEGVFPKSDGQIFFASEANFIAGNVVTLEAGENISTDDVVYFKLSDGKCYVSDTGNAADTKADGFAMSGVSSGADVTVQINGVYTTTGLTDKKIYYLGASGTISTTVSSVRIGISNGTIHLLMGIKNIESLHSDLMVEMARADGNLFVSGKGIVDSFSQTYGAFSSILTTNGNIAYIDTGASGTFTSYSYPKIDFARAALSLSYEIISKLDNMDDDSVSASWTTAGTVTETGGYLHIDGGAAGTDTAYWNADNYFQTTKTIYFPFYWTGAGAGNSTRAMEIRNTAGTKVEIGAGVNSVTSGEIHMVKVKFDGANNKCFVFRDNIFMAEYDLSSVTSQWFIQFRTVNDGSANNIRVFFLGENKASVSSTVTGEIRVDRSNWETVPLDLYYTFTNSGVEAEVRITATRNSAEIIILNGYTLLYRP